MGLLSAEVNVSLGARNIKYYENLGYKIPRREKNGRMSVQIGSTIRVKVEDLSCGSHVVVDCECDKCNKSLKMMWNDYLSHNHDGKVYCRKCSLKILNSGENHPNWNVNKTDKEREIDRSYTEYTDFIKRVLKRDNYTCQCCGKYGGTLEVHHLDGYNWCVEKRTDDTNGITLCNSCHGNFHSKYGNGENTKEQYLEWMGIVNIELVKYNGVLPKSKLLINLDNNKVYTVKECCKDIGSPFERIYDVCNHKRGARTANGYHLMWLDEYEKTPKEKLYCSYTYGGTRKKVICLETLQIYESYSSAVKNTGITSLYAYMTGKIGCAGKLQNGTKLHWKNLDNYIEQNNIKNIEEFIEKHLVK